MRVKSPRTDFKPGIGPQVAGGVGRSRIEFDADGALDALSPKNRERRGKKLPVPIDGSAKRMPTLLPIKE